MSNTMNIYYKYLSHIDEDTFTDPTIRLSVPKHLNDPFESSACRTFLNKYNIKQHPKSNVKYPKYLINHLVRVEINKFCIVSLSETSRNLLMWSHYANEHRGICIGYYKDFLKPESPNSEALFGHFEPIPVKYDSLRYYDDGNEKELTKEEQLFKILTNKSNEWIYEKEHRCIVPIDYADIIKLSSKHSTVDKNLLAYLYNVAPELKAKDNKYCPNDFKKLKLGPGYTLKNYFESQKETVLLKRIPASKINRIYFGCRYPTAKLASLISEIKHPSHPLHHVKLFRYELDDERFELKENLIYP